MKTPRCKHCGYTWLDVEDYKQSDGYCSNCACKTEENESILEFVAIEKDLLKEIDLYFKSGNNVIPDRATIPFSKWKPIQELLK